MMSKNVPNILKSAVDVLGLAPVIRDTRSKAIKTLGKAALFVPVALGTANYAEGKYRDFTGHSPEDEKVQLAETTDFGRDLMKAGERQKERIEDIKAKETEGFWGSIAREAKERTAKAIEWGKKEVVPIDEIKKELNEATKTVKKTKDATLEAGANFTCYSTFILTIIAQIILLQVLINRKKKKLEAETKESIVDLGHKKELLEKEIQIAKLQAVAEKAKYQLEQARRVTTQDQSLFMGLSEKTSNALQSIELDLDLPSAESQRTGR